MTALRRMLVLSSGIALAATFASADGDADEGRRLAEEWCARCHQISADGEFKLDPPSFAAIAVYRSADQVFSRISLPSTHTGMPRISLGLDLDAVDDLVAYITSLERTLGRLAPRP